MFNSLRAKIFLSMTLLVIVSVGGAAIITLIQGNSIAIGEARASLEQSRSVQESTASNRFQNLLLMNQLISSDPYFSSYIGQAAGSDLGFGETEEVDTESIVDLIDERNEALRYQYGVGFDFAYVLDVDGLLLASNAKQTTMETDFSKDALFTPLIEELETVTGYWAKLDNIYQIAAVPLASDDELVGFLVLGLKADTDFAEAIKTNSSTEYILYSQSDAGLIPLAGSMSEEAMTTLSSLITASEMRDDGDFLEVDLDGQHWLATFGSLTETPDGQIGVTASLVSLDEALEGFNRLGQLLTLIALGSVLLAIGLGFFVSARAVKPLVKLSSAANDAAHGNYRTKFEPTNGSDEIAALTHSLGSLLSDLREKSDMENFMESLGRLQPENEEDGNTSLVAKDDKPEEKNASLIGFEYRELMDSGKGPEELKQLIESAQRAVSLVIKRNGGTMVESAGYRSVAFFTGRESLKAALGSVPQVVSTLTLHTVRPVIALTRGKIITTNIQTEGAPKQVSFGKAWLLLDRLLSEAQAGHVLTTKNTGLALESELINLKVEPITGAVTRKQFPGISLQEIGMSDTFIEVDATISPDGTTTAIDNISHLRIEDVTAGMVLNDRYEIITQIGSGAMGVVFKTYDRELEDVIALKLMSVGLEKRMVDMMKTEIRLARKITDQNILRTFDFGEVDGLPFLSMEYVRGMTLKYILENSGNLPFSAAIRVSKQLCSALLAAHAEGIAHRDIKPANIMLDFSGKVKLMDFGLAGTNAGDRTHGGTPNYASPEQLLGLDVKTSGDIYSCGVVLYELFTGQLPFKLQGRSLKEMATSQRLQDPKPPIEIDNHIPQTLNDLILTCLEKDPDHRPSTIGEIQQVLEEIRA